MKILVAVDGSPYTRRMIAYLGAHDEWLGGQHTYTLLHAVPSVPRAAAVALEKKLLQDYYAAAAEKVFKPLRTFFARHGLQASFVSKIGSPAEAITELAAKDGHNLIVMGSHGHGTLSRLVMGSVAAKVLAQCEVPTLIIR